MSGHTRKVINTLLLLLFIVSVSDAQPNGEALFKANCAQCHSTGDNKVIGPGLKGILDRRDIDWLIKWTRNSQALIKAGDEYAVKIFNDYGKVVMPNQNLKDDEIVAIFNYVKAEEQKKAAAPAAAGPAADAAPQTERGATCGCGLPSQFCCGLCTSS
jgi:Cytochrome c, mono- and diheme variants